MIYAPPSRAPTTSRLPLAGKDQGWERVRYPSVVGGMSVGALGRRIAP